MKMDAKAIVWKHREVYEPPKYEGGRSNGIWSLTGILKENSLWSQPDMGGNTVT